MEPLKTNTDKEKAHMKEKLTRNKVHKKVKAENNNFAAFSMILCDGFYSFEFFFEN